MDKSYERMSLVGAIDPQLVDNTSKTSDWAAGADFEEFEILLMVGATATTVNAKVQGATDASGTGAADLTGKAITELEAADDNKQVRIRVSAEELRAQSKSHLALVVTVGDGTSGAQIAAAIYGLKPHYLPADEDLASVDETVD